MCDLDSRFDKRDGHSKPFLDYVYPVRETGLFKMFSP